MRILSLNTNGLRAAIRKGFYDWLASQDADFVCLQEIKARPEQVDAHSAPPEGYHCFYEPGEQRGRHGVALFSRQAPDEVIHGFGSKEFDPEGRTLEARLGNLSVISVYVPAGVSSEARLKAKFRFMRQFAKHLQSLSQSGRDVVLCGDFNIAHNEIDLENATANKNRSGFLPRERRWLDKVFGPLGFVDVFRELNCEPGQYTWWSNRHPTTFERNVGWRLDYQIATPALAARAKRVEIVRTQRFSDHAPILVDYED